MVGCVAFNQKSGPSSVFVEKGHRTLGMISVWMRVAKLSLKRFHVIWMTGLLISLVSVVSAANLEIEGDVVGEFELAASVASDTLSDLARAYDQGYLEMRQANPDIDPWLPGEDTEIVIPSRYVLPDTERTGLVVNVPEMRLYYFPPLKDKTKKSASHIKRSRVVTHPISIGRQEWNTPHGLTKITEKVKDPSWYPPESVREEHAAEGDILPKIVPAGPDNPLGAYKMRLGIPGYLIHGTNKPYGIGMRVTHGCIRMYPKDVESIFQMVSLGTQVAIVNQPYKVGLSHGAVYVEIHPHLEEDNDIFRDEFTHVVNLVLAKTGELDVTLDWQALRSAIKNKSGMPAKIGFTESRELAVAPEAF